MLKPLCAALFGCLAFTLFSDLDAWACQMNPAVSRRVINSVPPLDPDADVVLETLAERWQPVFEGGREIARALHSKVIRVIKGDPSLTHIVQYYGNGACANGAGPIGGRGYLFGLFKDPISHEIADNLTTEEGQKLFFGDWFSPAEASEFSWIRNHSPPQRKADSEQNDSRN